MRNIYIPPHTVLNPKGIRRAWAAIWCAGWEAGVGTMRVETTFLWMSDLLGLTYPSLTFLTDTHLSSHQ